MVQLMEVLRTFMGWFPRLIIVDPDEEGVLIRLGRVKRAVKPGWYIVTPWIEQIVTMQVTPQIANLPNQSIMDKDGRTIGVSGAIEYEVENMEKAAYHVQNVDNSMENLAMGFIAGRVRECSGNDIDLTHLESKLAREIAQGVSRWGLKVTRVWITDFVFQQCIRVMGDGTAAPVIINDESEEE